MTIKLYKNYVTDGVTSIKVYYLLDNTKDDRKCITIRSRKHDRQKFEVVFYDAKANNFLSRDFRRFQIKIFEGHELYEENREKVESFISQIKRNKITGENPC